MLNENITDIDRLKGRYERARVLEQESLTKTMALNSSLYPKWITGSDSFIYEREPGSGKNIVWLML